ncbi:MAG: endonuclease III [Thermoanaerobaculales bacterium]|nr:endonuclease III [Thermoanaerobaculales bacterium]
MGAADRAAAVVELLAAEYPDAECELDHASPWELLVATVLSAQSTDQGVNRVTPGLFARWPGPRELAAAPLDEIEAAIRPTGLFRTKAANLRETARRVVAEHDGEVPGELAALVALPGVGRKTAKVVLGEAFGVAAGIAVDTHVGRLARRLGLAAARDPERVAAELEALTPRASWVELSKRLVLHGRRVCHARRPACGGCVLAALCPRIGV